MNRFNFIFCYVIWQSLEYTFVKILILFSTGAVQKSHKDTKEVAIKDVIKKIFKKSFHLYCFYLIGFFTIICLLFFFPYHACVIPEYYTVIQSDIIFCCNKCILSYKAKMAIAHRRILLLIILYCYLFLL